ncbi:thioredoxin domain-containing protein bug [Rhynchophorus ferrugineus]|uniref:thioredoxin domain-containing protein bug n=1 Tax=Rhynchophorus ferrugineus TaxID=354439 RepID=UPI003FCDC507
MFLIYNRFLLISIGTVAYITPDVENSNNIGNPKAVVGNELDRIKDDSEYVIENTVETYDNETLKNSANVTGSNATHKFINCLRGYNGSTVQLVNDTELIKLLVPDPKIASDKNAAALCIAVLFYSKTCPFSSMAAPHFNALPRAFPDIKMVAINAMRYHLFNTQNGIVGVPTLLLFHNGRAIVRYNDSEYNLESFIKYIKRHTLIEPQKNSVVTSYDFTGPVVSSPSKESDMLLIISWLFIITCLCYYFSQSKLCKYIAETIQRNWRESEQHIEHEHID